MEVIYKYYVANSIFENYQTVFIYSQMALRYNFPGT
jgi:hypothetical protein